MLIDTAPITEQIPNLDGLTVDDLRELENQFKALSKGFMELKSYAEAKAHAMQCRVDGKIELAKRFEDACDAVYNRMPDWCKSW